MFIRDRGWLANAPLTVEMTDETIVVKRQLLPTSLGHEELRWTCDGGTEYSLNCPIPRRGCEMVWSISADGTRVGEGRMYLPFFFPVMQSLTTWELPLDRTMLYGHSDCCRHTVVDGDRRVMAVAVRKPRGHSAIVRANRGELRLGVILGVVLAVCR